MRFWFDTEFIEDGRTIDLISIGVFAEDGRKFYAESAECDLSRASPWVVQNVFPHLTGRKTPRAEIARMLVEFMGEAPEIWAYYADYDWVVLCQLFCLMIDLPRGWPMYCRDVKQLADDLGNQRLPKQETAEHNALADAIQCARAWHFLKLYEKRKTMTDEQIKHMVNRFLGWKLPENFSPDGGVSFKAAFNEHTANPIKHEPSGTNLLDATQADAMVRYMIEGLP